MINQKVCNCLVGYLNYGWRPYNLTEEEYARWTERDPKIMEKYFEKFCCCPRCGRELRWLNDYQID